MSSADAKFNHSHCTATTLHDNLTRSGDERSGVKESVGLQPMPHARLEAVTRDDVIRASKRIAPKRIQKWSVLVGGKEFPAKQILMAAANGLNSTEPRVTPADCISHFAVNRLKKLGFT